RSLACSKHERYGGSPKTMVDAKELSQKLFGAETGGRLARAWGALSGRAGWFSDWHSQFGSEDDAKNALSIFPRWVTAFHQQDRSYGAAQPLISDRDDRIAKLHAKYSVDGRSVLELGPLEGGHTKQMLDLGARSVLAIESSPEAFLKCLTVKAAF